MGEMPLTCRPHSAKLSRRTLFTTFSKGCGPRTSTHTFGQNSDCQFLIHLFARPSCYISRMALVKFQQMKIKIRDFWSLSRLVLIHLAKFYIRAWMKHPRWHEEHGNNRTFTIFWRILTMLCKFGFQWVIYRTAELLRVPFVNKRLIWLTNETWEFLRRYPIIHSVQVVWWRKNTKTRLHKPRVAQPEKIKGAALKGNANRPRGC